MNSKIKKILALLLSVVMVMSVAFVSTASTPRYERPELNKADTVKTTGTWNKDDKGFWSLTSNQKKVSSGWYYANMLNSSTEYRWYNFDEKGNMMTGWVIDKKDPDIWYYTSEAKDRTEGSLVTGWVTDPQDGQKYYMDPATGVMFHGWHKIDTNWYYFAERKDANRGWAPDANGYWTASKQTGHSFGALYKNETTPDGYYVDGTGSWRQTTGSSSSSSSSTSSSSSVGLSLGSSDPVMTATATTSTAQYAGQKFDTKGLIIKVLKDGALYKTVTLPDSSVPVAGIKVTVNGTKDGDLVAGSNNVNIEFLYYDPAKPDVIIGQSMTTDVFTVDAQLVYPEITGLDAALANKTSAEAAMNAQTVFQIPLTLNDTITGNNTSGVGTPYSWPVQIYDVASDGTVTFGPALGENSILYNNIVSTYRKWNPNYSGATGTNPATNYATSHIRATLVGSAVDTAWAGTDNLTKTNCLLSCFPSSLTGTNGIVEKKMTIPTGWSTSSPYTIATTTTIEDKLWLYSANELYGDLSSALSYEEGGTQMQLLADLGVTKSNYGDLVCKNEGGSDHYRWLRSPLRYYAFYATGVNSGGDLGSGGVNIGSFGLAPGFCLKVLK